MPPYQKFTLIEDLPDLEQNDNDDRVKRFLRNKQPILEESGMISHPPPPPRPPLQSPQYVPQQADSEPIITCKDVYDHIETCPVCKRLYKQDNTILIIVIAFLAILCILLIKKILSI